MKIALVSAVWGRVPLTQVWWLATERVRESLRSAGFEARVFVAGSEVSHRSLCAQHAGEWCEAENFPVGDKWNTAARHAIQWGADYLLILGSDDFMSPALVDEYISRLKDRPRYFGLRSLYMHEPASARTMYVDIDRQLRVHFGPMEEANGACTYVNLDSHALPVEHRYATTAAAVWNKKSSIGAGRLIHRSFFEPHEFYWESKDRALDASLERTLSLPEPPVFRSNPSAFLLDVKTHENIWTFDALDEWFPDSAVTSDFLSALPEWDAIRNIVTPPGT